MGRTFAIGDIHGDLAALENILAAFPPLDAGDTIVFLGDYIDCGPHSAEVMERVMALHRASGDAHPKVVVLRGNHEDSWLRVIDEAGFLPFTIPRGNGCFETLRSYEKGSVPADDDMPSPEEAVRMMSGSFLPPEHCAFMREMPFFYEDEHAIYLHGGIPKRDDAFPHPSEVEPQAALLWCRDKDFFRNYRGKLVVFGHTATKYLPAELSSYTPEDPEDLWAGPCCAGIDTRCGKGGFLTALELPKRAIYESRRRRRRRK